MCLLLHAQGDGRMKTVEILIEYLESFISMCSGDELCSSTNLKYKRGVSGQELRKTCK